MDLFDIVGPIMVGPSSSHTGRGSPYGLCGQGNCLGSRFRKQRYCCMVLFLQPEKDMEQEKLLWKVCWECRQMITRLRIVMRLPHSEHGSSIRGSQAGRGASEYGSNLSEALAESRRRFRFLLSEVHGSALIKLMVSIPVFPENVRR